MDQQEISRRIRNVFNNSLSLGLGEEELAHSDRLDAIAGMDSIALLVFVIGLEKEFGITIEREKLGLAFLRDQTALRDYVASRLA
jgi:acyl carrier protein